MPREKIVWIKMFLISSVNGTLYYICTQCRRTVVLGYKAFPNRFLRFLSLNSSRYTFGRLFCISDAAIEAAPSGSTF